MTEDDFLRLLELEFSSIRESHEGRLHAEVQRVDVDAAKTGNLSSSRRLVEVRRAFTECANIITAEVLSFREARLLEDARLRNNRTTAAVERLLNDEYQRLYSALEDKLRRIEVWNPTMGHQYSLNVAVLIDKLRKELEKSELLSRRTVLVNAQLSQTVESVHAVLDRFQFSTTKGHLNQGIAAHARADWAAANAQFRAFIESLFDDIARHLGCPATAITSAQRRTWLAQRTPPFFDQSLHEWDFKGAGFMESFFRRLHPQGAHPGLSSEPDSSFRLGMILLVAKDVLRRL